MDNEFHDRLGFVRDRLDCRWNLIHRGVDPYPYAFTGVEAIDVVRRKAVGDSAKCAGRVWSVRSAGKAAFVDLKDHTGRIQLYLRSDRVSEADWETFKSWDVGDVVGASGHVMITRAGELSLEVDRPTLLGKAVVPVPLGKETKERSYYRPTDPEVKYRQRYLHWILDDADRKRIETRTAIIAAFRARMVDWGFLEVTTPTLEMVYGGAEARPFKTEVWALGDQQVFLRVSPELYLKRYIVAGFPRVFTICQNFRNEGIDRSHNPEFTMMEWYEAFTDYEDQMLRFETLVAGVCEDIHGSSRVRYQGQELDFTPPWRRLTVCDAVGGHVGADVTGSSVADLQRIAVQHDVVVDPAATWGEVLMTLFETLCEPLLQQPTFVVDHPLEISPLTKSKRGNGRLAERFEPYAAGMEIGNAYSELTDPVAQAERLVDQRRQRRAGQDYDDHPVDEDFLMAVGCGMPPTGGVGLGIDRLVMLLTDARSIRDIIPFPMVKPRA